MDTPCFDRRTKTTFKLLNKKFKTENYLKKDDTTLIYYFELRRKIDHKM